MLTDPKTNEPIAFRRAEKEQRQRFRQERIQAEAENIQTYLKSENGKTLVSYSTKIFEERIEDFLKNDPECKAILKLLKKMGEKLDMARSFSERKIKEILG